MFSYTKSVSSLGVLIFEVKDSPHKCLVSMDEIASILPNANSSRITFKNGTFVDVDIESTKLANVIQNTLKKISVD
jgi:hypothetical protein